MQFFAFAGLLVVVAVGAFARFHGLGLSPMSVDEFYFYKAVTYIRESGVPEFAAGGGFYTRGILQQYLTAALASLNLDMEFTARLLPALASLAALPATFLIGRRIGGTPVAVVSTVLMSLSLWEIEFARFARMYAPLQAIAIWQTWFLLRAASEPGHRGLGYACAISFIGIFLHTESLYLLAANLLPLLLGRDRPRWIQFVVPLALIAVYFLFNSFSHTDTNPRLPPELMAMERSHIELGFIPPTLLLRFLTEHWIALLLFVGVCGLTIWSAIPLMKTRDKVQLWWVLVIAGLPMAIANQLGLAVILLVCGLILNASPRQPALSHETLQRLGAAVIACMVFWVVFGWCTEEWYESLRYTGVSEENSRLIHLMSVLFNYPETITRFLKPMAGPMPVLTLLLLVGIATVFLLGLRRRRSVNDDIRLIVIFIVGAILFISLVGTHQKTSRYAFFFFPHMLLTLTWALWQVCRLLFPSGRQQALAMTALSMSVLFLSEDFNWRHLRDINTPEIMFRTSFSLAEQNHYYPRRDFSGPAHFVNAQRQPGDRLISEVSPIDLYLQHPIDIIYLPMEQNRFWTRAVEGATLDRWTGAQLVYRYPDLLEKLKPISSDTWLIVFAKDWSGLPVEQFRANPGLSLRYTNADGTIDVFLIEGRHARL